MVSKSGQLLVHAEFGIWLVLEETRSFSQTEEIKCRLVTPFLPSFANSAILECFKEFSSIFKLSSGRYLATQTPCRSPSNLLCRIGGDCDCDAKPAFQMRRGREGGREKEDA